MKNQKKIQKNIANAKKKAYNTLKTPKKRPKTANSEKNR